MSEDDNSTPAGVPGASPFGELTADDWRAVADWVAENVEVVLPPGVDAEEVELGYHDPAAIRAFAETPDAETDLSEVEALTLRTHATQWQREQQQGNAESGASAAASESASASASETAGARAGSRVTVSIGTSPWRADRRENPPLVPLGREDLVWLEWMDDYAAETVNHFRYHRAEPTGEIPVVGGAANAVLTTVERAEDLGASACPGCFIDRDDGNVTVFDQDAGTMLTLNMDAFEDVSPEAIAAVRDTFGSLAALRDAEADSDMDSDSESESGRDGEENDDAA